jgi:type I restriction enzyme R subunit
MASIKSFTGEDDVEQEALDVLVGLGYQDYRSDSYTEPNKLLDAERDNDHAQAILKQRLRSALERNTPGLSDAIYAEAVRQFSLVTDGPDIMENNHRLHQLIIEGAKVKVSQDGQDHTYVLKPIDFSDVEANDFVATNQYTMVDRIERRPDITIFINGLPLITFELKNHANEMVGIEDAYKQLQTYKQDISDYMAYNEILVISDGVNARAGSLSAGLDRFMQWRAPDQRNDKQVDAYAMETLINNMMRRDVVLDLIENFIIFENDGARTFKILAAYHQYYMVNKAVEAAATTLADHSSNRIGVVWHTQGSGKSLSMVFFTGIVSRRLGNPTILVVNDRNDLDDQLGQTFAAAHDYLRQTPAQATSRTEVRDLLERKGGGIVFSTIQKFAPEGDEERMPVLNTRSDIIVISDEAHRSQYGLKARFTDEGVRYGYAQYMREALPNASFIGFTGTPIDLNDKSTRGVFGDYIDVYDMSAAVRDHATVRIYYENHIIPLDIDPRVQFEYDGLMKEAGISEAVERTEEQKRRAEFTKLERLAGTTGRLEVLAQHFVKHFEARQAQEFGKSIIVEMSRRNAVKLYDEIIRLRPDWHSSDLMKGKIKVIMTSDAAADGPEIARHHTTAADRRKLQKRMRDEKDELQVVIVVDMWLTGFDAPAVNTMYIDKPMRGHNLMQAIARVNRVFKDKDGGLIVDYIGIADSLKAALKQYSASDQEQTGINVDKAVMLMKEKYDIITNDYLYHVDYGDYTSDDRKKRQKAFRAAINAVVALSPEQQRKFADTVVQLQKAHALVVTTDQAAAISGEMAFFVAVKNALIKLMQTATDENRKIDNSQLNMKLDQLVNQSVLAEKPIDLYEELGLERPELSLLSEDFLDNIGKMPEKSLAMKLLERLVKGKIKAMTKVNLVQSRKFGEMLEASLDAYNQRGVTTELVIRKLIELAKSIQAQETDGQNLGLSLEEKAFYDALADEDRAAEEMGADKLQEIAKALVKEVRDSAQRTDWVRRESARASMRIAVKRLLRKYGYPPDFTQSAVDTVVEQAEKMAFNETVVGELNS